ncbi:MAG TPA: hypothetical protein DEA08_30305 [Planctomycetes bacterium]|nr:hypothetical protein [Planctomycetota bacterium]
MTIRVTPRDDEHRTCPYCRDEVTVGPSCASCGTLYHTECAMTFALCATLGCQQRLTAAGDAVALPRISALARRLSHWRVDGLGPRGPQALILEPSPGAHDRDDAALAVAELLGGEHTAYDGRMRLRVPYPEPLARFDTPEQAAEGCARLRSLGVAAYFMPLSDLVRPLEALDVSEVLVGADEVVLRARLGERSLRRRVRRDEPRLLVLGRYVAEESKSTKKLVSNHRAGSSRYGGYSGAKYRSSLFPSSTRKPSEPAAFLFLGREPTPAFLLKSNLSVHGVRTQVEGWKLVRQGLAGGEVRELEGETAQPLLGLTDVVGQRSVRDNRASLALIARLHHGRWLEEAPAAKG